MIPCFIKLFTSRFIVKLSKLPIVDTTIPGLFTFHLFFSNLNTNSCGVSSDSRMYLKIKASIFLNSRIDYVFRLYELEIKNHVQKVNKLKQ